MEETQKKPELLGLHGKGRERSRTVNTGKYGGYS